MITTRHEALFYNYRLVRAQVLKLPPEDRKQGLKDMKLLRYGVFGIGLAAIGVISRTLLEYQAETVDKARARMR